jgi:Arc/MetJ family transcription regulator
VRSQKALARKNLIVDEEEIRALKRALGAATESEAVRIAVRDRLALEEAQTALRRIRTRGGIDDVFHCSSPDLRKQAG